LKEKTEPKTFFFPQSLDQIINPDNEVHIIELFAESIKLEDFHFVIKTIKEGRPAYHHSI